MTVSLKELEHRVRMIVEDQDQGRWPKTKVFMYWLSLAYRLPVTIRSRLYEVGAIPQRRLPCKTIAVGNLTVGGTGKTPMAIYLATLLQRLGRKPAILSRGYKGHYETTGSVVSDGCRVMLSSEMAGDEPVMMAESLTGVPVLVGRDRFATGTRAVREFGVDTVICDDAYQHLALYRDIDLLLMDCTQPFGNGRMLPRGPLREALDAHRRAHAIIFTRCTKDSNQSAMIGRNIAGHRPYFFTRHEPYIFRLIGADMPIGPAMNLMKGANAFAFSGIARNAEFRRTLTNTGCEIVGFKEFPDHHRYTESEIKQICAAAVDVKAHLLVTTEKDFVRITQPTQWPMPFAVFGIRLTFGGSDASFDNYIEKQLKI